MQLEKIYAALSEKENEINGIFEILQGKPSRHQMAVREILTASALDDTKQSRFAAIERLVNLKDESLVRLWEAAGKSDAEIAALKGAVYEKVRAFYETRQDELIAECKPFLSPFYLALIDGVHKIGRAFNAWAPAWSAHIIDGVNKTLASRFGSAQAAIEFLRRERALEYLEDGSQADRAYSVLASDERGGFGVKTYGEFFEREIAGIVSAIDELLGALDGLQDDDFHAKKAYADYFSILRAALLERNAARTVASWRAVDEAWMKINSPFQVCHLFEYYEDNLRRSVAPEFDLRLQDPSAKSGAVAAQMKETLAAIASELGAQNAPAYEKALAAIDKTKLFISRPMLYYGAELNGLFSAQVVPNDETVSKACGKKIFAYADNVRQSLMAKPFMRISSLVFEPEFLREFRAVLFENEPLWKRVYEASTIGHEFGHILWIDDDTESLMNKTGNFKNIEEFKATAGGLVNFFLHEQGAVRAALVRDLINRSVRLVASMKTGELIPYYTESLIHLSGLFSSGMLEFGGKGRGKLSVDLGRYGALREWYLQVYKRLARAYLQKEDAGVFLGEFAEPFGDSFLPVMPDARAFVEFYWDLHQKIGTEVEERP